MELTFEGKFVVVVLAFAAIGLCFWLQPHVTGIVLFGVLCVAIFLVFSFLITCIWDDF
jgi:hypothetical protein